MNNLNKVWLTILFVSLYTISLAQPANDDCLGAQNVIDDGSCVTGTTVNANDNWVDLIGCQGGPGGNGAVHPDVWYSFTATNSSFTTTVTAGTGWAGTIEVTLMEPDAFGCGGVFTELASDCATGSATVTTTGLIPGNTYYIIVSNPQDGTPGSFDICTETTAPSALCTDNQDCTNAAPLGLPASGAGPICVTDCNTGAAPGIDFTGNNCYDQNGPTVWYEFTTDALHTLIDITLTSTDFPNPEFTIFENTCNPWTIINGTCTEGTGGVATLTGFQGLDQNTTYLIAIGDVNGGSGDFELCIEQFPDNSPCNTNSAITETASSDPNTPVGGPYSPGEVVSFCYNITDWNTGPSCNYLQGIVPTFGSGWDPSSFDANGMPVDITTPLTTAGTITLPNGPPTVFDPCDGESSGTWDWYTSGSVIYNNILADFGTNGALPDGTPLEAGWFFTSSYDPIAGNCDDVTDPNNAYGDNDFPNCNNTLDWNICFNLTVGSQSQCTAGTTDLTVSFQTYADGEIGAYTSLGCIGNIPQTQVAEIQCCPIFDTPAAVEICDSYTLPEITGSLLSGNEAYFTGTGGTGTQYNEGDVINFSDFASYPVTLYIYDPTSCGTETSFTLTIGETPTVTLPALSDYCIDAGVQTVLGGGTVTGGVYSGTGVTDAGDGLNFSFDPAAAGVGTHTVTYTVTNTPTPPACPNSATSDIEVFPLPVLSFTAPNDLCVDAVVQNGLGGATPIGGTYSGNGVTDDGNGTSYSFDPATAGVGTHTITYTFSDVNGCTNTIQDDVEVFALPVLSFTALADLCIDAGVQSGSGATPTGGVYSGTGITDDGNGSTYSFDPISAGVGTHTITYTFTNLNGCTNTIQDDVEVFALPVLDFTAPADLCIDAGVQNGLGGATPSGGVYSGPGITDNGDGLTYDFDPAAAGAGVHNITYTYTDGNGCTNTIQDNIEVFPLPVLDFPALAGVCLNAGSQNGIGAATVTGGTYSGPGVTDDGNGSTFTFDPIVAGVGIHTVVYTYTDLNSCTNTIQENIEVYDNPTISGTLDACVGLSSTLTGSGTPNATNPWTSSDTGIADVDVNGEVSAISPGTVIITYTDDNGCSVQETFTSHPNPVITLTPTDPTICDGTDGFITVNGSGTGQVNWSGAATGSDSPVTLNYDITTLTSGSYNVYFTDGTTGCVSNTASTSLNNPGAPIINSIADTMSCEIDFVIPDPSTFITGTNLTGGQSFYSAPDGNPADELVQGTVITSAMTPMTIYAYDNNGTCEGEVSFLVEVNENPTTVISPDPAETCEGVALNLSGNPTGGSGTYSNHEWTGDVSILNATNVPNPNTLTSVLPNTYNLTYTVTDNNGCVGTDDITVQVNEVPELSGTLEVCVDLTTTISSTGNPDAVSPWSSSDATIADVDNSGVVTGVAGGTADITFLDANGCDATVTVTVNENPVISLTPTDPSTCNGSDGSIVVNGTGTGEINWAGDATGTDSPVTLPYTISNLEAGTFDVTFTNGTTSCVSNNPTETLINPNAPVIDLIDDTTSCAINYVVPDASTYVTGVDLTGNQEFYSAPGGNIGDLVASGTEITPAMSPMTLYAYDVNGTCSSEVSFVVTINENPTASISPDPAEVCAGLSLQLNGNPSGGSGIFDTHEWTNTGATSLDDVTIVNPVFSNAVSNTYDLTYTVTDNNGCSGTSNITVNVNPNPVASITPNPAEVCAGIDLQMNGTPSGGSGTYTNHEWTDIGATSLDDANIVDPIFNNVTSNNYDLIYTVTDDNGCVGTDNIVVTVNENPTTAISPDPAETCAGIDLLLNGNPVNGSSNYTNHEWTNTGASSLDNTSIVDPTFNNTITGTYDLTYTVTDDNGCIGSSNLTVTVNENPTINFTPDPAEACSGDDLQINGGPTGGSGVYTTHLWSNSGSTSLNDVTITDPLFNNANAGNYDLTYTVTDDNGCEATDNMSVSVIATPVIDPLGPITACDSYELPVITGSDLSGNEAYYDDTQANNGNTITGPINSSATIYIFDGASGCSSEEQVDITINPLPEVTSITGGGEYCDYEVSDDIVIEVSGTPDWIIEYTVDGVTETLGSTSNSINIGNNPGVYELVSLEDNNCNNPVEGNVEIIIKPSPDAPAVSDDQEYCSTADLENMTASGSGTIFTWYEDDTYTLIYGEGSQIAPTNITGVTSYFVSQTLDGCESELSEVIITINDCDITIPTAITPDNDGNNDTWEVLLLDEAYPDNHVQIFNRWGNLLFEHNSKDDGPYNQNKWDGKYNGKVLPVGSYYYVIDFNNQEGESATGAVSIILD